jgi:hypothetical protein
MSDFVEECRREWKRLRVPPTTADEMAADLAADLEDAEADGAAPEELLGDGVEDPRAFAHAWAKERGLIRPARFAWLPGRRVLLVGAGLAGLLVAGVVLGAVLESSHPRAVPHSTEAFVTARYSGSVVGTSLRGVRLAPGNEQLPAFPSRAVTVLHRAPTSITVTIDNSGQRPVRTVTLVVQLAGHTYRRTTGSLRPGYSRKVAIALPGGLPPRFTLAVRSVPQPGERNTSNNHAAWGIRVRS